MLARAFLLKVHANLFCSDVVAVPETITLDHRGSKHTGPDKAFNHLLSIKIRGKWLTCRVGQDDLGIGVDGSLSLPPGNEQWGVKPCSW